MPEGKNWAGFNLGTPAHYVIKVRGWLDDAWAQQMGLSLSHISSADGVPLTMLTGQLVDQAALFGILNALYGLGFPLLAVESTRIEAAQEAIPAAYKEAGGENHLEPDRV